MLCRSVITSKHFNDSLNGCQWYADKMRAEGELEEAALTDAAIKSVLQYSYLAKYDLNRADPDGMPDSVHVQVADKYCSRFWEVGILFDLDAEEAGYAVDYASPLVEKRKRYFEEKKAATQDGYRRLQARWEMFQRDYEDEHPGKTATKKAFADFVGMPYGTVCHVLNLRLS